MLDIGSNCTMHVLRFVLLVIPSRTRQLCSWVWQVTKQLDVQRIIADGISCTWQLSSKELMSYVISVASSDVLRCMVDE